MTKLLLLPNLLGESPHHELFLPASVDKAVASLQGLIAESERAGRRYLGRFLSPQVARSIPIALWNKKTPDSHIDFLLEPIRGGERWGYVSDAGLPCIADPGAKLVFRARQLGIKVQAFIGPSSIFLALMLSGLPGQRFRFHGYLNVKERIEQIRKIEKEGREENTTQIFMETPYRNPKLLDELLLTLDEDTYLSVAWDLTLPTQGILTQTVRQWKKSPPPNLLKKPAIYLIANLN